MKIQLCSQCEHPIHLKPEEREGENGTIEFEGGCTLMVVIKPLKKGGYYHEHCDCDGGIELKEAKNK